MCKTLKLHGSNWEIKITMEIWSRLLFFHGYLNMSRNHILWQNKNLVYYGQYTSHI